MLDFLTSCFRNYKTRRSLPWHHFCNMLYLVCHIYPYLVMFWWLKLWDSVGPSRPLFSRICTCKNCLCWILPILRWEISPGNFLSRRNFSKTQFVSVDNLTRKMERTSEKFNPTSISLVNAEDKGIFFPAWQVHWQTEFARFNAAFLMLDGFISQQRSRGNK